MRSAATGNSTRVWSVTGVLFGYHGAMPLLLINTAALKSANHSWNNYRKDTRVKIPPCTYATLLEALDSIHT